ncbi:ABC transporter permease [Pararhizobium gei]|uniref:ABC transporter permease n=1 Tax=Pararhizobium gei TaxID=1395951 RepID=UPI0023DBEF3B|nr:ABC transporter permease [Rhizobium gei]
MNAIAIGLSRQVRIVSALTIREVRLRNSKHAFTQLFDLLEAVVFIVVHYAIFKFLGRHIPIGDSLLLFISTGILPVLFFRTISIRAASAIEASKAVTAIPYIEAIDYAIARSFVEFLSFVIAFAGFFALIGVLDLSRLAVPYNPIAIVQFLILISLFGFGIGLINSFLAFLFPLWTFIWGMISRVQIFFSAVFYIPEYMPPQMKEILVYNPIMHFVALFRTAFYSNYPTHMLSMNYMIGWTFGVMLVGLALERALRNHRANGH